MGHVWCLGYGSMTISWLRFENGIETEDDLRLEVGLCLLAESTPQRVIPGCKASWDLVAISNVACNPTHFLPYRACAGYTQV